MNTKLIVILTFDQANLLDISGPAQIFNSASTADSAQYPLYDVRVTSETGGLVKTNAGISIDTVPLDSIASQSINTLIVAGGSVTTTHHSKYISNWIRTHESNIPRIGSVCTGAFITAESGILDGKRAVTHWRYFEQFKQRFPAIYAERDPIYIKDNNIWSSAGVTAGIDLSIAMVQEDHGRTIALETARDNVVFMKRPGGQNQYSVMLDAQSNDKNGDFDTLHHWIFDNLSKPLSVEQLASQVNMSPRNFSRKYTQSIGISPARSVELARLETARRLLEDNNLALGKICSQCGFGNDEKMRRVFLRHFGITAKDYRQRFKNTN